MFEFKHPKYYKELRMQYGPHKAISDSAENSKAASVRPGSRPKRQASSSKQQASSVKLQASSLDKPQATSSEILEPGIK